MENYVDADDVQDPMKRMPKTKFSQQILKSIIGDTRANQVLTSFSMNIIPAVGTGSMGGGIKESKYCFGVLCIYSLIASLQISKRIPSYFCN